MIPSAILILISLLIANIGFYVKQVTVRTTFAIKGGIQDAVVDHYAGDDTHVNMGRGMDESALHNR